MSKLVTLYSNGTYQPIAGSSNGDVLTWNSATSEWEPSAGGSGTVTSVGLDFGSTGLLVNAATSATITTSGTFAVTGTLAIANGGTGNGSSVAINTVFAGPSVGSAGAPGYRALVVADLPTSGIPASSISSIPYDIAGSAAGVPTASAACFYFVAVRACSIAATGHRAKCKTAPTDTVTFTLKLNGASIGTVQYTVAGGTTGTVSITSGPVAVVAGDSLTLDAPSDLFTMSDPYFTLFATLA